MSSIAISDLSVPHLIDAIVLSPSFDVLIENVVQDFFFVPTPIVLGFLFDLLDLLSVYPSTTIEWRAFVQQIYNTIGVTGPVVGPTIANVINVLGNPATPTTYPADWISFVTANVANNVNFKTANNANVLAYLAAAYARVGNWATFMGQILNTDPILPLTSATPNSLNPFIAGLEQSPEFLAWLAPRGRVSSVPIASPSSGGTLTANPFVSVPNFSITSVITTDTVTGTKTVVCKLDQVFIVGSTTALAYINLGMLDVAARPPVNMTFPMVVTEDLNHLTG